MTLLRAIQRRFGGEAGSASVEFVILVPVFLSFFMLSVETGVMLTRQLMLERAVDLVMRDVRLSENQDVSTDALRSRLCARAVILRDCAENLVVEITTIDRSTYALPDRRAVCDDLDGEPAATTGGALSGTVELRAIRVCYALDPLFPALGLGVELARLGDGRVQLTAASVFVPEPPRTQRAGS